MVGAAVKPPCSSIYLQLPNHPPDARWYARIFLLLACCSDFIFFCRRFLLLFVFHHCCSFLCSCRFHAFLCFSFRLVLVVAYLSCLFTTVSSLSLPPSLCFHHQPSRVLFCFPFPFLSSVHHRFDSYSSCLCLSSPSSLCLSVLLIISHSHTSLISHTHHHPHPLAHYSFTSSTDSHTYTKVSPCPSVFPSPSHSPSLTTTCTRTQQNRFSPFSPLIRTNHAFLLFLNTSSIPHPVQ